MSAAPPSVVPDDTPGTRLDANQSVERGAGRGCAPSAPAYFAFSTGSAIFTGAGVPPWPFFG